MGRRFAGQFAPFVSIVLLTACSQGNVGSTGDGEPAGTAAEETSEAAPSQMVQASTPAAEPSAAVQPGADNLCAPGEPVIFSCQLKNGKSLSVCAAAEEGGPRFAQYRYGATGQESELVWPATRAAGPMKFVSVPYSGGGEAQLSFARGGTDYVVYSRVIRTGFGAEGNQPAFEDGVLVMKGGKTLADHRCQAGGLQSVDYDKAERYAAKRDDEIIYPN